jgi:DNA repair protein RadC
MEPNQSHSGHRGRLLKRFEQSAFAGMHDYEIIELLLTCIIPLRDTKPIAKELIQRFGGVSGILNASSEELHQIKGIGSRAATFLTLFRELIAYCLAEKFEGRSIVAHRTDVEAYLKFNFGHKRDEYIAALFLDNGNHVIRTELLAEGTVNQCSLHPRTIIERAIRCGAAAIILAHNHPGGTPRASEPDWSLTTRLFQAGKLLDMALLDHIIITRESTVSLREHVRWPG